MRHTDYAAIEVGSVFLDAWTSYSFQSDLFTAADSFRLSLGVGTSSSRELRKTVDRLQALMKPETALKLWIGSGKARALQAVGIVDGCEIANDADGGTTLTVQGRDPARHLIGSAADPKLYEKNDTLLSVARRAVALWGIEVTADHVAGRDLRQARVRKDKLRRLQDKARSLGIPPKYMSEKIAASIDKGTIDLDDFAAAARFEQINERERRRGALTVIAPGLSTLQIYQLRVKDIRPQSGETVWEYLDRHAQRNGLLMQMDPQGRLVFCGLQYDQAPSYRLVRRIEGARSENNIISGGRRLDAGDVYKTVLVYGRAKGDDKTRSAFKGRAVDAAMPFEKTLLLHDNSIKSRDDAQTRAEYELAKSRQGADALEYTVAGHSADGLVFATDTIAHIEDQVAGINGPYYVTARTFTRSTQTGPMTQLKLVPPHSIVLKEAA
jgi:prophage tail gpP-like protein